VPEPSDAMLQAFFAEHAERYAGAPRYDFVQVIVPNADDPDGAPARALLERLAAGEDPEALGLKVGRSRRFTLDNAAGTFGPAIARALAEQEPGTWHLVAGEAARTLLRVDAVAPGDPPPLHRIRNRVVLDFKAAHRAEAMRGRLEDLRERYDVRRVE